jgi:hypothetical protein
MRHAPTLISIALLSLAAQPALSQEQPRVLFCMGQCYGIDKAGERVPLTKGTALAPGLRLETGPDSYLQVKLGNDAAFGMGERARVRLESVGVERAALALDQGRVRVLDGEAIGRASTRRVELQTSEGNIALRGADIEVKAPPPNRDAAPTPTLVKLNVGEARLGELPVTKDVVHGILGGKLDREMPMSDIVLRPRGDSPATAPSRTTAPSLPVAGLPVTRIDLATAIPLAPAIVSLDSSLRVTTLGDTSLATTAIRDLSTLSTTVLTAPQPVTASTLQLSAPLQTISGTTTTLRQISSTVELSKTTTTTTTTTTVAPVLLQPSQTLPTTTLSPKTTFSSTTFTLR